MWFVYILLCSNNTFYTGITNNLEKRFQDHKKGRGGAYTRSHIPIKIIYIENFPDRSSALKREFKIKNLSRTQKEILIQGKLE